MIFEYRSLLFVVFFKPSIHSISLLFLFLAETFEINHFTNRYRAEEPSLYLFADYFSDKSSIDQKNLEKRPQCTIEAFTYTIVFFYDVHQCNWINDTYVHHGDIHKYLLNFSILWRSLISFDFYPCFFKKQISFVEHHHLCPFVSIVSTMKFYNFTNLWFQLKKNMQCDNKLSIVLRMSSINIYLQRL